MKRTVAAVIAAVVMTVAAITITSHPVPACQEDEVVQGTGDFHPSGYWDAYECVNLD